MSNIFTINRLKRECKNLLIYINMYDWENYIGYLNEYMDAIFDLIYIDNKLNDLYKKMWDWYQKYENKENNKCYLNTIERIKEIEQHINYSIKQFKINNMY